MPQGPGWGRDRSPKGEARIRITRTLVSVTLLVSGVLTGVVSQTTAASAATPSAQAVALASLHSCLLTTTGGVQCWGNNVSGELGNGTNQNRSIPVDVSGLGFGTTQIDAGGAGHSCAVTLGSGLVCWGRNRWGQLGNGGTGNSNVPVAVVGLSSTGDPPVKAVSTGGDNTCALVNWGPVTGGGMECWGRNETGQLGDGTTNPISTPVQVFGLTTGVAAISAGGNHTCALMTSGGLKCWGANGYGQVGDGTTTHRYTPVDVVGLSSGVKAISNGGAANACALMTSGGVKCWGSNAHGQLGDGTRTDRLTPVDVSGLTSGVVDVAAGGGGHVCAVTSGGAVKCWGLNDFGQLGNGTASTSSVPVQVSGLTSGATSVSTGGRHSCALLSGGALKCWGRNDVGEVGDGSLVNRSTPVDVGDATPPQTVFTTTPATPDAQGSYGASVNVVAAGNDFGGSGTAESRCALDPPSAPSSFSDLSNPCPPGGFDVSTLGDHVLYGASKDTEGNTEDPVAAFPFRLGHRLSVTVNDSGGGTSTVQSSPAGIDCGATCTADFPDTDVTLTATPGDGSVFVGWSGGGCSGTSTCTVSMGVDRSVTATFAPFASAGPITTIAPTPASPNGPGGSYKFSVHLTVTANDPDSPVAETRCALDPSSAPAAFADLPPACGYLGSGADVSTVGHHVLYAASRDGDGNIEAPVSFGFEVVDQPDAPTSVAATGRNKKVTVTWQPPSQDGGRPITGYTVTASPGSRIQTLPASATSASFGSLTNCTKYTVTVTATNALGYGPGSSATAIPASIVVSDSGYSRGLVTVPLGQVVTWCFDPDNASSHSVTSDTGVFDSGPKAAGESFVSAFAAGRYPYHSTSPPSMSGTVSIKVVGTKSGTGALIAWAKAPPAPGASSDVQVKRPGSTKWVDWKPGTTDTSATFSPADPLFTSAGTYSFRSRFRNSGGISGWSSATAISIG